MAAMGGSPHLRVERGPSQRGVGPAAAWPSKHRTGVPPQPARLRLSHPAVSQFLNCAQHLPARVAERAGEPRALGAHPSQHFLARTSKASVFSSVRWGFDPESRHPQGSRGSGRALSPWVGPETATPLFLPSSAGLRRNLQPDPPPHQGLSS